MTTNYDERQRRQAEREKEERRGEVKIGEASGKVSRDMVANNDVRIRIDNVEELRFRPAADIKKGDSVKITIEADWTRRGQEIQRVDHHRESQIGEALGKATRDIHKTNDVRIRIDNVEVLRFRPSVDLKKGDSVRITIVKM